MDMSKQSLAQNVKLKCRLCAKEIYRKNYKAHLETTHPNANAEDLSPLGQVKITSMFQEVPRSRATTAVVDQGGETAVLELDTNTQGDDNRSIKRRHESGESVESGYFEAESSEKKKKNTEDSNVSINTLNDKLDQILEEVRGAGSRRVAQVGIVQDKNPEAETPQALTWLKNCRSMQEVLEAGFMYDRYSGFVTCTVCSEDSRVAGKFYYSAHQGLEFDDDEYIPRDFSNLKRSLTRHIVDSKAHLDAITDIRAKEKAKANLKSKNRQAGLNLGRLCMEKYLKGRPYTDYETDVLILAKSGATVGELNHSRKFPAAFRPSVSKVVHSRVEKFLGTPLRQTGHLPPCAVSAIPTCMRK